MERVEEDQPEQGMQSRSSAVSTSDTALARHGYPGSTAEASWHSTPQPTAHSYPLTITGSREGGHSPSVPPAHRSFPIATSARQTVQPSAGAAPLSRSAETLRSSWGFLSTPKSKTPLAGSSPIPSPYPSPQQSPSRLPHRSAGADSVKAASLPHLRPHAPEQPAQPKRRWTADNLKNVAQRFDAGAVGVATSQSASSAASDFAECSEAQLVALAERMAHELDVRDRSYHLKKYASCFVGSEAVTWMVSAKVADDADHAVVLGNEMLRLGLLHHVKHEHAFENKYLFYRFHDLSSDADSELDNPCGTPRSTQSTVSESAHVSPGMPARDGAKPRGSLGRLRGTNTGKGWSLAGEVTRVQRRLCDVAADLEMQKSMCDVMFDSTAEQLRGNQQINVILEQKLREILTTQRRTNRVLQVLSALVLLLLLWLCLPYLAAFLLPAAQVAVNGSRSSGHSSTGSSSRQRWSPTCAAEAARDAFQDPSTAAAPPAASSQAAQDGTLTAAEADAVFAPAAGKAPREPLPALPAGTARPAGHAALGLREPGPILLLLIMVPCIGLSIMLIWLLIRQQRALWAADTRAKRGPAAYEGGDGSWETLPRQPSLVLPLHAEAFAPGSDASASDDTETMVYATEPCLGTSDRQQAEPSTAQPVPGPEPPSIADFEDWPDAPALCRMKPGVEQRLTAGGDPTHIPYNTGRPIQFESELFKGCVLINVAGLSTAPADLFQGKRRKTSLTVQGRFKQPLGFDDVLTGQEFNRAPTNLPGKWLVETVLMKMAKRISPSMVIGPLSAPYVLVPIIAMAQSIHVGDAESAPDPAGTIPEDMTALDPSFTDKQGQPWAAAYRKRFFLDAKQRADRRFDTDKIWTFAIYQHFVDMGTYELDMIHRFDLSRHLDGQPLQFMAKDKTSGQYLFNFEAWHEKLLPAAEAHYMKQQAAAGTNSSAQPSPEPPAHS